MTTRPELDRPAEEARYGGRLMFAQSWEDPACDISWLKLGPGSRLFAITSGADNVLDFLLEDPAEIVAADINPLQTHLAELKVAAIRVLPHASFLNLLGIRSDEDPARVYHRGVRGELSDAARAYWDGQNEAFSQGLLTQGGFERYFAILRGALRVVVGRRKMEELFTLEANQQRDFFARRWNTFAWRSFLRIGCSKWFLGNRLDPSWFAHSDGPASYGDHFAGLARHAISEIPARTNYFLAQIFLGRYVAEEFTPRYLHPAHFETLRGRVDRIRFETGDILDVFARLPSRSLDTFALSNVFEYSPASLFERTKDELARVATAGARITLRNLLAPRRLAEDDRFEVDAEEGDRLRRADRGFIYSHFEAARYAGP